MLVEETLDSVDILISTWPSPSLEDSRMNGLINGGGKITVLCIVEAVSRSWVTLRCFEYLYHRGCSCAVPKAATVQYTGTS